MTEDRPERRTTTALALLGMSTLGLMAPALAQAEVRRHALIVGSNDGGAGMEPLFYAEQDAVRVADLLSELGGFAPNDITVLTGLDAQTENIRQSLVLHTDIAVSSDEDLFLFYYSGHADSKGLRLGPEVMRYTELRRAVNDVPADVRLGVLDACRSGEITRIKGLTLSAPFATAESLDAEGEAWLTAASADESAQESDQLQGSFFTHYLISGLRGAADKDDGVVSLEEAYAYARDRTVARTGLTDAGAQHPIYDYDLQGSRNLPLTDVRRATARVHLAETLQGEIVVLRQPEATPVAELAKVAGVEMTVALPPGTYDLRLRDSAGVRTARIGVSDGAEVRVPDFSMTPVVIASRKGGDEPDLGNWSGVQEPGAPVPPPPGSKILQQSKAALDELTLTANELATGGKERARQLDLRHNAWVAALASAAIPGAGQAYNGEYLKTAAFLVPYSSFVVTSVAVGAENGWRGTLLTGPSFSGMAARMTLGWAVADAWDFHRPELRRPTTGVTVGHSTGWHPGGDISSTGYTLDWIVSPGFSLGIDRSGWFQRPDGTGEVTAAGRMMWAPWDKARLRPALFMTGGVVVGTGPKAATDTLAHTVVGVGGNLRWYATPRYFLEFDARAEREQAVVRGVYGGGLGVHLGR